MPLLKSNDFWKPNTYYYSTNRYKSLIEYDNILYICTMSHLSGDVFDEAKFNVVSGSGSGSGSSSGLIPAGEWDIDATFTFGPPLLTTPRLSIPLGSDIANNTITYNSELPTVDYDSGKLYGATTTNGIANDFAETKWISVINSSATYANYILSLYQDTPDYVNDIYLPSQYGNEASIKNITFDIITSGSNKYIYTFYNDGLSVYPTYLNFVPYTEGEDLLIGINTTLGKIYYKVGVDGVVQERNIPTSLFTGVADLKLFFGATYFSYINQPTTTGYIKFPANLPSIQEFRPLDITTPPELAVDGSLWKVISTGVYDNQKLSYGDYVLFYNNLENVALINNASEINEIQNSIMLLDKVKNTVNTIAIARGIIDYIGTEPPIAAVKGHTFLASQSTQSYPQYTPLALYVYTGSVWQKIPLSSGEVFTYLNYDIKIQYTNNSTGYRGLKHINRVSNPDIVKLTSFMNHYDNNKWVYVENVRSLGKSVGYTEATTAGGTEAEQLIWNIVGGSTESALILNYEDTEIFNSAMDYTVIIKNSTNIPKKINIITGVYEVLPMYPLTSSTIHIGADSMLTLLFKRMYLDNTFQVSTHTMEYVSGSYPSTAVYNTNGVGNSDAARYNVTDVYITVSTVASLSIPLEYGYTTPNGYIIKLRYKVTADNSSIVIAITHTVKTVVDNVTSFNNVVTNIPLALLIGDTSNEIIYVNGTWELI